MPAAAGRCGAKRRPSSSWKSGGTRWPGAATALGLLRGWASGYAAAAGRFPPAQCALRPVMRRALASSGLTPGDLQHVDAHGRSGPCEDRLEAEAIVDVVGQTPVTSPTSFFGVTGAASGPLEMAVSVLRWRRARCLSRSTTKMPTPPVPWRSSAANRGPHGPPVP